MTQRRVVLHIGIHKTGSSAIQAAFRGFQRGGVLYPSIGPENHSVALRTAFDPEPATYGYHRVRGISDVTARRMGARYRRRLATLLEGPAETLILSGEDVSQMPEAGIDAMLQTFKTTGRHIVLMAYVRDPVSFASSMIVERLKHGHRPETAAWPGYRGRLKPFLDRLSREDIVVRDFRSDGFPSGNVVEDFADALGISEPPSRTIRENTRLSSEAADILISVIESGHLTAECPQDYLLLQAIVHRIAGFGSTPYRLPAGKIAHVDRPFDRTWLGQTFGIHYPAPETPPDADPVPDFGTPDWQGLSQHLRLSESLTGPGGLVDLGRGWAARERRAAAVRRPLRLAQRAVEMLGR